MNSPKFRHFVITLFNLQLWHKDKNNRSTQTADWLRQRFDLFETYCLPSVRNQTCKDFLWLCLFDKDTPEPYRERIRHYEESVPQFRACFFSAEEVSDFRHPEDGRNCRFIRDAVASFLSSDDEYVLTTNLDNDDALHRDMVGALQRHFLSSPRETLYSFNWGVQYFVKWNALMKMRYPHNHFLSLSERTDKDFRTIEFYGHTKARKCLPVTDIFEKPYWMEVVHGTNVSNELRITSRIRYTMYWRSLTLNRYGVHIRIAWWTNLTNNLLRFPLYFWKIAYWRLSTKRKRHG